MKDLIDRAMAIDALRNVIVPQKDIGFGDESAEGYNDGIDMAITTISGMPLAQPERAKDFVMLKVIDLNGRPYYSIIYLENGNEFEGYSSYDLKVISEYLKRYFGFAQPEQRWIPCDKGEPDEDMECWVTVKTTDALYRGNFTKRYGERRYKGFITSGGFMWWNTALAWMPIYEPEPYKEDDHD